MFKLQDHYRWHALTFTRLCAEIALTKFSDLIDERYKQVLANFDNKTDPSCSKALYHHNQQDHIIAPGIIPHVH